MDSLKQIVRDEVAKYSANGRISNAILFLALDDDHQNYAVISVPYPNREEFADVVILVRVVGEKVVVESNPTDEKLIDVLLQRGIPREQIVLAYFGEPIPDAERFEL
jgi:hypothetical protein